MDKIVAYPGSGVDEKEIEAFIKNEGERLYKQDGFFRDLSRLMENKEFQGFHNKYLSDWTDIETTMMYMKLYKDIKATYSSSFSKPASKEIALFIAQKIISNHETRRFIIDKFTDFKEGIDLPGLITN